MTPATPKPRTLRAATAGSLAADAATVEAVGRLEREGMSPLLLKGPALARLLYEPSEVRTWSDADLLVGPSDHAAAMALLAELGFEPRISDVAARDSVPHAVHLIRTRGPYPESIDLHRSFAGVEADPEVLWRSLDSNRESIDLFGRRIGVPSTHARLALVALHAASHGRPAERSMEDLRRAAARFGVGEWRAAAALAEEWEALDYFVVGLGLDPAGSQLLDRLGIERDPGTAAVMRGEGMPRAQRGLEQLGRAGDPIARARLIARKTFPNAELMRMWKPLAHRGRVGLALAYAWRPLWLLWQLGPALRAYLRARRG